MGSVNGLLPVGFEPLFGEAEQFYDAAGVDYCGLVVELFEGQTEVGGVTGGVAGHGAELIEDVEIYALQAELCAEVFHKGGAGGQLVVTVNPVVHLRS